MATLSGWRGNRADDPVTIEVDDNLARTFMATRFYHPESMLRPGILNWLSSSDGCNVAWENTKADLEAIDDLYFRVRAIEKPRGDAY